MHLHFSQPHQVGLKGQVLHPALPQWPVLAPTQDPRANLSPLTAMGCTHPSTVALRYTHLHL